MKTFRLTVSTPDGSVFSGAAVKISVRGSEGDLAILADHIPFITFVRPCEMKIELEDGREEKYHTEGGVITTTGSEVTFLTSQTEKK